MKRRIEPLYQFQDFIGKSDEEIKERMSRTISIENLTILKKNFDYLKRILSFQKCSEYMYMNFQ